MCNFCAHYVQNYSDLVKPLCDLTRTDVPWEWGSKEETALNNFKAALTSDTVLSYFNTKKHTNQLCSAEPGLTGDIGTLDI